MARPDRVQIAKLARYFHVEPGGVLGGGLRVSVRTRSQCRNTRR